MDLRSTPIAELDCKEIFFAALEKGSPEELACYLDKACGENAEQRLRVEQLLRAHHKAGNFLGGHSRPASEGPIAESPGTQVGPYKLLQQIGEGGFGVVYMAEQQQPVRRKVALKIIKPGMDTKEVIARFESERQALALMDHPNIARVLDAGATESGRPYFVMELVKGIPITQFCDNNHMPAEERLELFVQVCHALQHAHQKGIIHRDLKPTNVMVTMHDGRPVPKVIDFGVAKATSQTLTERTLFTAYGQMIGTPAYMSPEQAEMSGLDIDTRSDIYSLGVLLYELLTGTTPFEAKRLREAGFVEMQRIIREEEPPKPSTRVNTLQGQALTTLSRQHGMDERGLKHLFRGELDWIVMKSLDKDREQRYESAVSLARDIRRYLADEPVQACPPSALYRFRKYARKHRTVLTTAALLTTSLLLGTAITARQAVRATTAEAQAEANEKKAVANEQKANTERNDAQRQRDEVTTLNDKLHATNDRLEAAQAELRSTLYAAHMNLAKNAWENGGRERAEQLLDQHRPKPGETDLRGFEWHYLFRLCHAATLTFKGHDAIVLSVAFSPDGKRLVSSARDGSVKVWDAETGKELLTLKGHLGGWAGSIQTILCSPDGKRVAGASVYNTITVWDMESGRIQLTIRTGASGWSDGGPEKRIAFSPDGKRLAGEASKGTIKIWDAETGQETLTLEGHTSNVHGVDFSPDGKRLVSAASDSTVKIWNAETGEKILSLNGSYGRHFFSPDGKRLVGGLGNQVKVWEAATGEELLSIEGSTATFTPDGERLIGVGNTGVGGTRVKVWDAETGQELHTFQGHTEEIRDVAICPDGKRIASASADGTGKLWDLENEQQPIPLASARDFWGRIAFSRDEKRVASAVGNNNVKVWDLQSGQELLSLPAHIDLIHCVAFSPDGKRLATGSGQRVEPPTKPFLVKVWDATSGKELLSLQGGGMSVAFSPDGNRLASSAWDGTLKVWDAHSGDEQLSVQVDRRGVDCVAFHPDGDRLVTGSSGGPGFPRLRTSGQIKMWDAKSGAELWGATSNGPFTAITSVIFSPNGTQVASAAYDKMIKVWDAKSGKQLHTLQGHTGRVNSVVFSPDGKRLVSTAEDESVKIWDTASGQELLTFKGQCEGNAFSSDGQRLFSVLADGTLVRYDATPLKDQP